MSTQVYPGGQNGGSGSLPPAITGVEPQVAKTSVTRKVRTKVFFIEFLLRVEVAPPHASGAGSVGQKDSPLSVLNGMVLTRQVTGNREQVTADETNSGIVIHRYLCSRGGQG